MKIQLHFCFETIEYYLY